MRTAAAICTVVSDGLAQCTVTAHVPTGQLAAMGTIVLRNGPGPDHFAIVGGAGRFGTAQGTVTARSLSQTRSVVVIHLTA